MKTRLLGAAILIALAVIFVPMFFSSSPPAGGEQNASLDLPPAPDRELKTRTMDLALPPATSASPGQGAAVVTTPPPAAGAPSDRLATVNIGSNRPRDVETDPEAGRPPEPTTVSSAAGTPTPVPAQPPAPTKPSPSEPLIKPRTPAPAAAPKADAPSAPKTDLAAGTATRGHYLINLGAYASASGAQNLIQKVRALGYPVASHPLQQGGKSLTQVSAGPFETRAAAEAARLKIAQSISGVPARLESGASDQRADTASPAPAAARSAAAPGRVGGFAVQVAAMASQGDANALRDRLRAHGFDGFVDSVEVGGKRLWRVRVGPQTQRADAERLRDQLKTQLGLAGNVVTVP